MHSLFTDIQLIYNFIWSNQISCFTQYTIGNMILQYRFFTQFNTSNRNWCKSRSIVDTSYCNSLEISTFVSPLDFSSSMAFLRYCILSWSGKREDLRLSLYSIINFLSPQTYTLGIAHDGYIVILCHHEVILRHILLQRLEVEILFCVFYTWLFACILYVTSCYGNL